MANPIYATLVAATVATVTLDADYNRVEVVNVDGAGSAPIYFTVDGSDPAVATNGSIYLPGTAGAFVETGAPAGDTTDVKLISAGTPKVQVRGL